MKFHVVTTMNLAGWEETGRRMVNSFMERWPTTARLILYAEGFTPDISGVEVRRLPEWAFDFNAKNRNTPSLNGKTQAGYDYRFDAVKFAWKVAAMTDCGVGLADGVMIWLDADTFTHAPVSEAWLEGLFPERAYVAWLERRGSYPETGFLMFRCSHPYHASFMESLRNTYVDGAVLKMRETHDAAVIHHVLMGKVGSGKLPQPVSISGDSNWHHPFVSGPLGECLDHLKGARKREGTSRRRDLKHPRSEPYWASLQR